MRYILVPFLLEAAAADLSMVQLYRDPATDFIKDSTFKAVISCFSIFVGNLFIIHKIYNNSNSVVLTNNFYIGTIMRH